MSVASPNSPCPQIADLAQLQPFGDDVCASWSQAMPSLDLHRELLLQLQAPSKEKRVMMLGAPRAGFGKTHLLGRWVTSEKDQRLFIALPWEDAESLQWLATAHGLITNLSKTGEASETLRSVAAGIMTSLLARSIRHGKVPCGNPEVAVRLISQDPLAVFGEEGEIQAISQWFRRNFHQLVEVMAAESQIEPKEKVVIWLKRLFEYALHPTPDNDSRLVALLLEDQPKQLMTFLKLITLYKPVVLIADHMDALFGRHLAGVTVASFSVALATLPQVEVVLCLNRDLWEVTFEQQLPSALQDRLDANPILMEALKLPQALELVKHRLNLASVSDSTTEAFLQALHLERWFTGNEDAGMSPRSVLRLSAQAWGQWTTGRPIPAPEDALVEEEDEPLRFLEEDDSSIQKLKDSLRVEAFEEEVNLHRKTFAPKVETLEEAQLNAKETQGFLLDHEDDAFVSESPMMEEQPPAPTPSSAVFAAPSAEAPALAKSDPAPETSREPHSGSQGNDRVVSNPHLQELRDRLSKLNRSAMSQKQESSLPTADTNSGQEANEVKHPTESVLESTYRAKLLELGTSTFPVDGSWWEKVLALAAENLKGYRFHQIASPSFASSRLFSWISEDEEVYFGVESASERSYWKFVATYLVGRRVELDRKSSILNPKLGKAKLRLIKLATNHDTTTSADCLREMGVLGMTTQRVLSAFTTVDVEDATLLKMNALLAVEAQELLLTQGSASENWQKLLAAELDSFRESVLKIEPQEPAAGEVA